ncbi:hypothetical protein Tco_0550534 [Tanacetum coccineum]
MCTYLKNMAGWKPKDLKTKSFANVQELFEKAMKRVNTLEDMDTKMVEGSETREEESSRREIHCVTMHNILYYLLVEKMYPLTKHTLHQMFNDVKLQVDFECEMAFELLRLVKKQLKEGYRRIVEIKSLLEVTAVMVLVIAAKHKLVLLVILRKNMLELGDQVKLERWQGMVRARAARSDKDGLLGVQGEEVAFFLVPKKFLAFRVSGLIAYFVTILTPDSARSCMMQYTLPTQGMRSIISMVSISPKGFLPSILLLVVIIVTVVIVVVIVILVVVVVAIIGVVIVVMIIGVVVVVMIIGVVVVVVSSIIKLSFVIIGSLLSIVLCYLIH